MKKGLLLLAAAVLVFSNLTAQKTSPAKVEKLVYPGVVFGSPQNPASCLNQRNPAISIPFPGQVEYACLAKCIFPAGFRERIYTNYLIRRNRLLDHLLA